MEIYEINSKNINIVSELMTNIKPEWWDVEGANEQLSSWIGWYCGLREDNPNGWILCNKEYDCYKITEIECLGYDNCGTFGIGERL